MPTTDYTNLIWSGFANNLLIVLLSSLIPLSTGILLNFFASKKATIGKVFGWVSLPFECICPLLLLIILYYLLPAERNNALFIIVIAFSLSFIGYLPARYISSYFFINNILYIGLGLISTIFKWSFCVGYIAYNDMLKGAQMTIARTYNPIYLLIPFIVSLLILTILEIGKRLIKQLMK